MSVTRWVALLAIPLLLGACGGDEPRAQPTPCPRRPPVAPLAGIPEVLDQTHRGDVVDAGRRRGFSAVTVVTHETVVELYPQLARGLVEGGHEIVSGDNEGFEAEIFFELRDGRDGRYVLREGPCRDDVTLHILYEERKQ
ncbi:MAG TPA: hypothetical protein VHI71_12085 [Actinomycetota bacterium]|nr:hypothetical protein [Actinomycetota bacterium]